MKILDDLQACQSVPHRDRGIGRYSLALASAMQRRGGHELVFALNAGIPDTIERIRASLPGGARVLAWSGIAGTASGTAEKTWRRRAAIAVRDAALATEGADIHLLSSYFEGHGDDVVVDIAAERRMPVAVTLYDLIPLIHQDLYLTDEGVRQWYFDRLEGLRRADLLLAISECTRRDAIEHLGFDPQRVVNISAAVDERFRPATMSPPAAAALRRRLGIAGRFLLYTGGIDPRKNIERLIEGFSRTDPTVRRDVQLVVACSAGEESRRRLLHLAAASGLSAEDLVLTGYVSDDDLAALYCLCEAFVFPSWYEGFGLPALEAMACGAAVIGADRASVPEVIGRTDALFDPFKIDDIAAKMTSVLCDCGFRDSLRAHAFVQARRFSWDASAGKALDAMQDVVDRTTPRSRTVVPVGPKPSLAFVSPFPPERTGIADYAGELLPSLSERYRITLVTPQSDLERSPGWADLEVRDLDWFEQHAARFDRILYQVGNSPFHGHMPGLLERFGGVVVLHDFFLSGLISHLQLASKVPGIWHEYLYRSHGYRALADLACGTDFEEMLLRYPCNLPLIENADGLVVHSEHARRMASSFYGGTGDDWNVVPFPKASPPRIDRLDARRQLGIAEDEFLVCSFGILGEGKLNHRLIDAWTASALASDPTARLVFVGGAHDPLYEATLQSEIANGRSRIQITGYTSPSIYALYLQAADVAVQLRQNSRGETSASVFDCLAYGIPTIVNAHGSMAELPSDAVFSLPDVFTTEALKQALEMLRMDGLARDGLSCAAVASCAAHAPAHVAACYETAIERAYASSDLQQVRAAAEVLAPIWHTGTIVDKAAVAEALSGAVQPRTTHRQLLIDVTEMVRRDAKSGIQRVVRSIVLALLNSPPSGYRVEPVYADHGVASGYRYARGLCQAMLGLGAVALPDEPVAMRDGDVFVGLDLALAELRENAAKLQRMRDLGVSVQVVVYDLLPLVQNEYFPPHAEGLYRGWLETIASVADRAVCISRSVADELVRELDALDVRRHRPLEIGFFHLGADIDQSLPTRGVTPEEQAMLDGLVGTDSFLMVGTIEPRKGHAQAIDAFELLWSRGGDQRLVIVGRPGWMTEHLIQRIRGHVELGKRLLWFQSATDEVLDLSYARSKALLAASEGEGFGLPLIEAARHGLPIMARDLPVFREVAGDAAAYFSGFGATDLADAIEAWRARAYATPVPTTQIPWLTWEQSARMLVDALTSTYAHWMPRGRRYLPVHDTRNHLLAEGRARGRVRLPTGGGEILQTRTFPLPAGEYRLLVQGTLDGGSLSLSIAGSARPVEIAADTSPLPSDAIARGRFHLDDDADALVVTVRSEGRALGEVAALIIEPIELAPPGNTAPLHGERIAAPAFNLQ